MILRFLTPFRLAFLGLLASLMIAPVHAQETNEAEAKPEHVDPRKDLENIIYLDLSTGGRVEIMLFHKIAPNHVERIKTLARRGYYDGVVFHRVIEGFMAQTGKKTSSNTHDLPDLKAEFSRYPHLRGIVSAARLGHDENSANSEFFITFMPRFDLDNKYTVFGRVFNGMQHVDKITRGEPPVNPSYIIRASVAADQKPQPDFNAAKPASPQQAAEPIISVK